MTRTDVLRRAPATSALFALAFLVACSGTPDGNDSSSEPGAASATAERTAEPATTSGPAGELALAAPGDSNAVVVYKSPTCGCCSSWVEHLEAAGFEVEAHDRADMTAVKDLVGVPGRLRSCHTALVGGYLVEGHVPASTIRRLLEEEPRVAGISVPGMPVGSPGMEVPGRPAEPYDVLAFDGAGEVSVYEKH